MYNGVSLILDILHLRIKWFHVMSSMHLLRREVACENKRMSVEAGQDRGLARGREKEKGGGHECVTDLPREAWRRVTDWDPVVKGFLLSRFHGGVFTVVFKGGPRWIGS